MFGSIGVWYHICSRRLLMNHKTFWKSSFAASDSLRAYFLGTSSKWGKAKVGTCWDINSADLWQSRCTVLKLICLLFCFWFVNQKTWSVFINLLPKSPVTHYHHYLASFDAPLLDNSPSRWPRRTSGRGTHTACGTTRGESGWFGPKRIWMPQWTLGVP